MDRPIDRRGSKVSLRPNKLAYKLLGVGRFDVKKITSKVETRWYTTWYRQVHTLLQ